MFHYVQHARFIVVPFVRCSSEFSLVELIRDRCGTYKYLLLPQTWILCEWRVEATFDFHPVVKIFIPLPQGGLLIVCLE